MDYNFGDLYKTETIDFGSFSVTVSETPHGAKSKAQNALINSLDIKVKDATQEEIQKAIGRGLNDSLKKGTLDFTIASDVELVASISSWTLMHLDTPVPVCVEAWRALPLSITSKIEAAIERLNPEMDSNFQD